MQMRIADLDPCMTAGFLVRTVDDLEKLRNFWKVHASLFSGNFFADSQLVVYLVIH